MGVGSGLGGQFGIKDEAVFGTYVAPTDFLEIMSAKGGLKIIRKQGGGLAAGRLAPLASQLVTVGREAALSVEMQFSIVKMGKLLRQVFGSAAVAQQGATAAYLQTHTLADTIGKSLCVQLGVPSTNGTVNPYSYLGGKITKAEFKCAKDDFLTAGFDFDFRDVSEAQALAVASYATTSAPFNFTQMTVKAGATVGAATALSGVTGFSLALDRKMATDRRYAGGSGLKEEPILNSIDDIASGSIDADLVTKADLADRVAADASFALVWEFTGAQIASPYNYQLTFEIPSVKLDGDTPGLDGPDIVKGPFPFKVCSNGTDPLVTCKYTTTDTTI